MIHTVFVGYFTTSIGGVYHFSMTVRAKTVIQLIMWVTRNTTNEVSQLSV